MWNRWRRINCCRGAINGMIKSLDPHSSFMTAEMYKELEVETCGSYGGAGSKSPL